MNRAPSGDICIVFTDIEGSTALWDKLPEVMGTALATHDVLLRGAMADFSGFEVKNEGDAFMVAFAERDAAIAWCLEVQRLMLVAEWPEQLAAFPQSATERDERGDLLFRGLRVRMGIHRGNPEQIVDPTTQRADYRGGMVNRAARVAHAAHGGQILLSRVVWNGLAGDDTRVIEDLGQHRFAGLEAAEHVAQLAALELAGRAFPPVRALDARTTNMVADSTRFVGRTDQLEQLASHFRAGGRVAMISGTGGVGKSRTAREFGLGYRNLFPGGVWHCDLAESRSLEALIEALRAVLEIPLNPGASEAEALAQLGRGLAGKGISLILLDSVDGLAGAAAQLIAGWAETVPDARFLLTARERLRTAGQLHVPLPVLPPADGVTLFVDRALAHGAADNLLAVHRVVIAELVHQLDALPLAIELAAARANVLSPPQILERLSDRFELLRGKGGRGEVTLEATIAWSWQQLTPAEQGALAQTSVFRGGFTLEAAEAVLDRPATSTVVDVLADLCDKSLLRTGASDDDAAVMRFTQYLSIQQFSAEQLEAAGGTAASEAAHARFFTGWLGANRRPPLAIAGEAENLLAVVERRIAPDPEQAARVALGLHTMYSQRGPIGRVAELFSRVLNEGVGLTQRTRVELLLHRADAEVITAELAAAERDLKAARSVLSALPDPSMELHFSQIEARWLIASGQVAEGQEAYQRALEFAESSNDPEPLTRVLSLIGSLAFARGDLSGAERNYRRAYRLLRRLPRGAGPASLVGNLGMLMHRLGRLDEATDYCREALAQHQASGNRRALGLAYGYLALIQLEKGRLVPARANYVQARAMHRQTGHRQAEAVAAGYIGLLHLMAAEHAQAEAAFAQAEGLAAELGDRQIEAYFLGYEAVLWAHRGSAEEARTCLDQASEALEGLGDEAGEMVLDLCRGHLQLAAIRSFQSDSNDAAAGTGLAALNALIASASAPRAEGLPSLAAHSEDVRIAATLLANQVSLLETVAPSPFSVEETDNLDPDATLVDLRIPGLD
jgi:predicted ATPase/class 3 adenylate cyclase